MLVTDMQDDIICPQGGAIAGVVEAISRFPELWTLVVDDVDTLDEVASGFGVA